MNRGGALPREEEEGRENPKKRRCLTSPERRAFCARQRELAAQNQRPSSSEETSSDEDPGPHGEPPRRRYVANPVRRVGVRWPPDVPDEYPPPREARFYLDPYEEEPGRPDWAPKVPTHHEPLKGPEEWDYEVLLWLDNIERTMGPIVGDADLIDYAKISATDDMRKVFDTGVFLNARSWHDFHQLCLGVLSQNPIFQPRYRWPRMSFRSLKRPGRSPG